MSNSSILVIDRTLLGSTTPGQGGPGSDSNEVVQRICQSSNITGASPSDYLLSYPGHALRESYLSLEMQSVCSTAPVDWARKLLNLTKELELKNKNKNCPIYWWCWHQLLFGARGMVWKWNWNNWKSWLSRKQHSWNEPESSEES